jgi:hypothetical protein
MPADHIRYDLRAQDALRELVRGVLAETARKGLPGEHHFYICFDTRADGVRVSARLRAQYPDEMTIVLQHQFWDLKVHDDWFEVGLSFGGVPERLVVPLSAIKSFVDPSVQFALQFEQVEHAEQAAQARQTRQAGNEAAAPASDKPKLEKPKAAKSADPPGADKPRHRRAGPPAPLAPAKPPALKSVPAPDKAEKPDKPDKPDKPKGGAEVVRLDRFRKK